MNILLTANQPFTSRYVGSNRANHYIAEELVRNGHKVQFVVPALGMRNRISPAELIAELKAEAIMVQEQPEAYVFEYNGAEVHAVRDALRLRSYWREQLKTAESDCVIVSTEDQSQSLLSAALDHCPGRVVYFAHTPHLLPFGPDSLYPSKDGTDLVRRCTARLCISQFMANYIKEWSGAESVVCHPPIYGSGPFPDGDFKEGWILLMNASAMKGLPIFLELARAFPNSRFAALPGYGTTIADRAELEELSNVTLLENQKNLDDILGKTKVLLMPSLWLESFGMAAVDAMLRGIPVLAANYGGLPEAKLGTDYLLPVTPITQFKSQLSDTLLPVPIVPAQNIEPWKNALGELISSPERYRKESETVRTAANRFLSKASVKPIEQVLIQASKQPRTPAKPDVSPKTSTTPETSPLANLSVEQRVLLQKLLLAKTRSNEAAAADAVEKTSRNHPLPLSFAQERMWFLEQLNPGKAVYNVPGGISIRGEFHLDHLREALTELHRRHELLRTTFSRHNGKLVAIIHPIQPMEISERVIAAHDESTLSDEITRYIREEAQMPFNLETGPLLRMQVLRISQEHHIFLYTFHHIITDAFSMGIFIQEFAALYDASLSGKSASLPELPFQYVDYAAWQKKRSTGPALQEKSAYWRNQLAGIPEILELPPDRPRRAVQTFEGAVETKLFDAGILPRLKQLAGSESTSLFVLLLAVFKILLRGYTGQDDLVVGTIVANRGRREFENLIGLFVNTLVIRTNISNDLTIRELIKRVKSCFSGALSNQEVPFERLVQELQPARSTAYNPFFQIAFLYQNQPKAEPMVSQRELSPIYSAAAKTSKFDLTFMVVERDGVLGASLEYNTDLYERETVVRVLGVYERILERVVREPEGRVGDIAIVSEGELERMRGWQGGRVEYEWESILGMVRRQVERKGGAEAVKGEGWGMSYGELWERSRRWGRYFRGLGVRRETLVGVSVGRGRELVPILLGIWQAGGVYVPLDGKYPPERLRGMMEEVELGWVVVDGVNGEGWGGGGKKVVRVEEVLAEVEGVEGEAGEELWAGQLAYVIYTSGSSGRPKAVGIEHRSLRMLLEWAGREYGEEKLGGVLASTSVSFDLSVFELWAPLSCGGRVILVENILGAVGSGLMGEVSLINTVPSAMRELVRLKGVGVGVKVVNLAGEALKRELVDEVYGLGVVEQVYDLYGPSEDTTYSTCELREVGGRESIGRPILNTEVYLLDEQWERVAVGMVGEIYLGGAGLGRGYLGRAEWTAERFLANPYGGGAGQRMYRTGDRGRYNERGSLEYLGRKDNQVKVRGYRIELGEVESGLRRCAGVREAVVVAREEVGGGRQLVGYVVLAEGGGEGEGVRRELRGYVPEYMVPAVVLKLAALPLSANGKIDRKRLPAPEGGEAEGGGYVAPRTAVEEVVAGVWAELLGREQVGVEDNFFELGGHSLLATQAVSRLRELFQVELPLRSIFEAPTVRGQAEQVQAVRMGQGSGDWLTIRQREVGVEIPLSFAQERLWFLDQFAPGNVAYHLPGVLRIGGPLDREALKRAMRQLIERHEVLRTSFGLVSGRAVQVIHPAGAPEYDLVVETVGPAEQGAAELERRIRRETEKPFDLKTGPLIRSALWILNEQEHLFLCTLHHSIVDGWSMGILNRELGRLYEANTQPNPPTLPAPALQYADYALWQRQWLKDHILEQQLHYWKKQLAGAPPVLNLPFDHPRPPIRSGSGALTPILLSAELSESLDKLARKEGVTLFMVTMAGLSILLHRYILESDIVIGGPTAGRLRKEWEELVGPFINMLVFRNDLTGNPTVREILQRVRDTAINAYLHQDIPFERLVTELQPERQLNCSPLFQVNFTFHNLPTSGIATPSGIAFEPVVLENTVTRYDLECHMQFVAGRLYGTLVYSTELFNRDTIERLASHFERVLELMASHPERSLSEISVLSPEEERKMVMEWNDTASPYPSEAVISELFEKQAVQSPEAPALIYGETVMTYSELNRRANQLAHHLAMMGVGPETVVPVCMDRTADLIVSFLAILKAGGVYMPLSPSDPLERIGSLLEQVPASILLAQSAFQERLPASASLVLYLDLQWNEIDRERDDNLKIPLSPDQLAYVMFTSGSTGTPKGIGVTHQAVIRLVTNTNYASWTPGEKVLQVAPISFDASTFEIWGALLNGGTLLGMEKDLALSPVAFAEEIKNKMVDTLFLTTALFNAVVREVPAAFSTVRQCLFGGETSDPAAVRAVLAAGPPQRLLHVYGPTENTTFTSWELVKEVANDAGTIPIGQPISQTRIHILADLSPVPPGAIGELHTGGIGLARGYLSQPGLTAEKFIPDRFSKEAGSRLYRTGDLARYLVNGRIEFIGRIDHQVKLHGYRIELGEIECAIRRVPGVKDCAVLALQDEFGEKRLVAYVGQGTNNMTADELRAALKEKLPAYMVPSRMAILNELPLTQNGKINRRALQTLNVDSMDDNRAYVAPRNPEEDALATIWADVLGVERVGINDNFFDLGGDSIKSIRVVARAKECGFSFSVKEIFQYQTIALLREEIRGTKPALPVRSVEPFSMISEADRAKLPVGVDDAYPLTKLQMGMIFHSEYHPESNLYRVLFLLQLRMRFDEQALYQAIQDLGVRHPILRTGFEITRFTQPLQLVYREVEIPLEIYDLRALPAIEQNAQLGAWAKANETKRFKWDQAPLLKFTIQRLTDDQFQFGMEFHHAIMDGWSDASLMVEFCQGYLRLLGHDVPPPVPPPRAFYRDYVASELEVLKSAEARAFWKAQLADIDPTPTPRWSGTPIKTDGFSGVLHVPISLELSDKLKQVARTSGVPIRTVLLAAHLKVLSFLTGQPNVLTGFVTSSRPEVLDGDRILGLFLNTLPFRSRLEGESWLNIIRDTFIAEKEMLAFRQLPLSEIQQLGGGQALFDSMFNFTHFHVYENIQETTGVEVLGVGGGTQNSFTLAAGFRTNLKSHEVQLTLHCNPSLVGREQLDVTGEYYSQVLSAMAEDPSASHRRPFLSTWETERIFRQSNPSEHVYDTGALHELFEEQTKRTPTALALEFEGRQWSYSEFNRHANRLAHWLKKSGVGPETFVAVCLERSFEMVVALYGILKAGGAYVPLEPDHPADRLRRMAEDAAPVIILTDKGHAPFFADLPANTVVMQDLIASLEHERGDNLSHRDIHPDNPVYMIYTSGSTGSPKGTINTHRGVRNRLCWMQQAYLLTAEDRVLQKTSFGFDVSAWEFFWPLAVGAALVLARPGGHKETDYLVKTICEKGVTTIHFVPPMLDAFLAGGSATRCSGLRRVICSGEALSQELQQRFFQQTTTTELHNLYGPTEASIDVSFWECRREDEGPVPIGRPIANVQLFTLDRDYYQVPVGAAGELYIAGVGLARGYCRRPDLTAERFICNPHSESGGVRMYKTGDLAKFRPDGAIEYLGRSDLQIKLRGIRIEPGEIEAAINHHPAIEKSLVLAKKESSGNNHLVAYMIPRKETAFLVWEMARLKKEGKWNHHTWLDLPNGMTVADGSRPAEMERVYDTLFANQMWFQHGVMLPPESVILNSGPGGGLLEIFASSAFQKPRLITLEPIPARFQALCLNAKLYQINTTLLPCGLAEADKRGTIDYFPYRSEAPLTVSGREAVTDDIHNPSHANGNGSGKATPLSQTNNVTPQLGDASGVSERINCEFKTVSSIIDEFKLEEINLLRIGSDTEPGKALEGIRDGHWKQIRQIVIECITRQQAHGILATLEKRAYACILVEKPGSEPCIIAQMLNQRRNGDEIAPLKLQIPGWPSEKNLVTDVRKNLRANLPEYIVPSVFILLDSFPMLSNGKIDRRSLPAAGEHRQYVSSVYKAPRTPLEKEIAEMCRQLLGVERVGVFDNLFELGGHSLLLTELTLKIRSVYQANVPLRVLFEHPTVFEISKAIADSLVGDAGENRSEVLEEVQRLSPQEIESLLQADEK